MGMSSRKVLAVTADHVVMCYSRVDGAACKLAAGVAGSGPFVAPSAAAPGAAPDEAAGHPQTQQQGGGLNFSMPGLLPAMAWAEPQFLDAGRPVDRIEAERLAADRFVVCFERLPIAAPEDSTGTSSARSVACSLGLVERSEPAADAAADAEAAFVLRPFAEKLELGPGRLVAVSVLEAGRRLAVCHQAQAAGDAPHAMGILAGAGRMAASCSWAEVSVEGEGTPRLKWTDDVALEVFGQSDGPIAGN